MSVSKGTLVVMSMATIVILCYTTFMLTADLKTIDKNAEEIIELELADTNGSTSTDYETITSNKEYYDNPAELDFNDIVIADGINLVKLSYKSKCSEVVSTVKPYRSPSDDGNAINNKRVAYAYVFDTITNGSPNVVIISDESEVEDIGDKGISMVSVLNIENISIFGKNQDGTIKTLFESIGNPSYKYTEKSKNKVTKDESETTLYVYDNSNGKMIVSADDENILSLKFELNNKVGNNEG